MVTEEKRLPQASPLFHLGYQPALDGLRGYAVLWVIAFHYSLPFGRDGLFGVDIFFALSGFLITVLVMEEWERTGSIQLRFFYARRILRLFPALVVMLVALSAIAPRAYLVSTLFYFTNWIKAFHLQPESLYLDHTWSLSIEEQYYMLWPVLLLTMLRLKIPKKILVLIPLFLGLLSAASRAAVWSATQDWYRVYMSTDLHADGLLLGSAFGLMTTFGFLPDFKKHQRIVGLISLITFLFAAWLLIEKQLTPEAIPLFGNLGVSLGTLVVISRVVHSPSPLVIKVLGFQPLVKIGVISYGLYLWHAPIGVMIEQAELPLEPIWVAIIKVLATFIVAGLSYFLVEKPLLKLKSRFAPGKSSTLVR